MRSNTWLRVVLAAALVLAGGAVLALAAADVGGRVVEQRVVVSIDGAVETFGVDDLADGETRELASGEHTVTVTRHGDRLEVRLDGEEVAAPPEEGLVGKTMLWVEDGEAASERSERVIVLRSGSGSEVETFAIRTGEGAGEGAIRVDVETIVEGAPGLEELHAVGEGKTMLFTAEGAGAHPIVVAGPGHRRGMVRFRCGETGSELLVPEADATADSYVCPATGCLMTRVEEPEVRVIKVVKTRASEEAPTD